MLFLRHCFLTFLPLLIALFGLTGCAGKLKAMAVGSFVKDVAAATAKHDDVDLVTQAGPTFLLLIEGLLESSPDDQRLLLSAAELYTSYGALVELDDPERARSLYHRAKTYGLKALGQKKGLAPLLASPYREFVQIRDHLKSRDLPLVFWAASSWGAWISTSTDSMGALADLPKVILLMEWILQENETFYFGSPHIFLGMYHAALPRGFGGNPEKSRHHFNRALEVGKDQVLISYVQMARYYARQVFDRELYVSLLTKALALPVDGVPELTLQNVMAQRMARKLLEETDEFF